MDMSNSNNGNKTILWIAGGCLAILICAAIVIFGGFGGLMWLGSQTPDNANIQLQVPAEVSADNVVELKAVITNIGAEPLEVSSIDIGMKYLNGFFIESTSPPYSETNQYDGLDGETFQTYYFYVTVAPGESLTIVFHARAVGKGDFSGNFDVCIDSDYTCRTDIVRTIVK